MRKFLLPFACLIASQIATAAPSCQLTRWSSTTTSGGIGVTLVTGGAMPVQRYAGYCGLLLTAPGNFVTDDSPNDETSFRARFYVLVTPMGAETLVLRARNAAGANMLTVKFTGTAFEFATSGGVASMSAAVTANRWYSIELNWAAGKSMTATLQGAGGVALPTIGTAASSAADRIDSVSLGWISGGTAGSVAVDGYESRRTTAIGRLCRGDANGDSVRNFADQVSLRNEVLLMDISAGQPDCNEDGAINSGDIVCVRNLQLAEKSTCATSPEL